MIFFVDFELNNVNGFLSSRGTLWLRNCFDLNVILNVKKGNLTTESGLFSEITVFAGLTRFCIRYTKMCQANYPAHLYPLRPVKLSKLQSVI